MLIKEVLTQPKPSPNPIRALYFTPVDYGVCDVIPMLRSRPKQHWITLNFQEVPIHRMHLQSQWLLHFFDQKPRPLDKARDYHANLYQDLACSSKLAVDVLAEVKKHKAFMIVVSNDHIMMRREWMRTIDVMDSIEDSFSLHNWVKRAFKSNLFLGQQEFLFYCIAAQAAKHIAFVPWKQLQVGDFIRDERKALSKEMEALEKDQNSAKAHIEQVEVIDDYEQNP